ncbi:Maf family protein [Gilvimarinus chinensis]|uniref:Maf family protein n=1 Tax=Gilvimarinus chinensis TaxID=396005 RepID=UPI00035C2492|nr:Maf family nucleotide pyrophosphatase [Gilvimarinus chinensis]
MQQSPQNQTPKLVLASGSRYRRELLEKLRHPFKWQAPEVDETPLAGEKPDALALRLAQLKAEALASTHPNSLIIGSDQVASLDGKLCGKPGSKENAFSQLKAASGKSVIFYTGLCLLNTNTGHHHTAVETYKAHFRTLTDGQIEHYLEQDQPFDCAGSFKSEALGIALFERLEGDDPNTLVGLPLIRLTALLYEAGIDVLSS